MILVAIVVSTIYLYKFNKELYHHFDYLAMEVADEEQEEQEEEERYRQDGSHRNRGGNEQLKRLREVSLYFQEGENNCPY